MTRGAGWFETQSSRLGISLRALLKTVKQVALGVKNSIEFKKTRPKMTFVLLPGRLF